MAKAQWPFQQVGGLDARIVRRPGVKRPRFLRKPLSQLRPLLEVTVAQDSAAALPRPAAPIDGPRPLTEQCTHRLRVLR